MLKDLMPLSEGNEGFGDFLRQASDLARSLPERWERAIRSASRSHTISVLHESRDEYRATLESHQRMLDELRAIAELRQQDTSEIDTAASGLRALHDRLFPGWNTLDDLYRIVIESLTLPASRLDEIARKHPLPQSWWDETDDPFSP